MCHLWEGAPGKTVDDSARRLTEEVGRTLAIPAAAFDHHRRDASRSRQPRTTPKPVPVQLAEECLAAELAEFDDRVNSRPDRRRHLHAGRLGAVSLSIR